MGELKLGRRPPLAAAIPLALLPALTATALTAAHLALVPHLARHPALLDAAMFVHFALWLVFAPVYLYAWVHFWDPLASPRIGVLGFTALASLLWLVNMFVYAFTGSVAVGLLRA